MSRKAAIYCRISRDREGAGLGVERQRADCEALAERLTWHVASTFVDNDMSAYRGKPRPAYELMLAAVKAGTVNAIIAWHPDRLHRSPKELEAFIDLLELKRVQVQTVQSGELDLSTPTGRAVARTVGAWSRFESEHKSARIAASKMQARAAGKWTGGPIPLGWKLVDYKIAVDRPAAKRIRDACTAVVEGRSLGSIAADWNRSGFAGRRWDYTQVRQVLTRGRNAGLIVHHGEIVGPAQWPAFVSESLWQATRAVFAEPSRRRAWDTNVRHLLSGIALCPCGAVMRSGHLHGQYVYRCKEPGRGHVARAADPADLYVRLTIAARLAEPDVANLRPLEDVVALADARTEAAALRGRLAEIAAAYARGTVTLAQLEHSSAKMRTELDVAEALLQSQRGDMAARVLAAGVPALEFWDADLQTQRAVVRDLAVIQLHRADRRRKIEAEQFLDPQESTHELAIDPETVEIIWR